MLRKILIILIEAYGSWFLFLRNNQVLSSLWLCLWFLLLFLIFTFHSLYPLLMHLLLWFYFWFSLSFKHHEFFIASLKERPSLFQYKYLVHSIQEGNLVSHQQHCLLSQVPSHTIREDLLSDVRIHCTQRVIQEIDIGLAVTCSGEGDPGFLSSRDVNSSLSYLGVESICELS